VEAPEVWADALSVPWKLGGKEAWKKSRAKQKGRIVPDLRIGFLSSMPFPPGRP